MTAREPAIAALRRFAHAHALTETEAFEILQACGGDEESAGKVIELACQAGIVGLFDGISALVGLVRSQAFRRTATTSDAIRRFLQGGAR